MQVSDAIYGKCQRYVCRERLEAMLDYEQALNRSRLSGSRGDSTSFFAFADTVSARNYHGTNECHAWMGIRYQVAPNADDSEIILHVRMRMKTTLRNRRHSELLAATGYTVMISDFPEYYRLAAYLFRRTNQPIGMAMGLGALRALFDEKYYASLDGGILESMGLLFKEQLTLFIYPMKNNANQQIEGLESLALGDSLHHLFAYLADRSRIVQLEDISHQYMDIHSPDVLNMIANGCEEWTAMVPEGVAAAIKSRNLFGYAKSAG